MFSKQREKTVHKDHCGPNFPYLRDTEQDPIKLFKKCHVNGDDIRSLSGSAASD
jgi:hypothetical protein